MWTCDFHFSLRSPFYNPAVVNPGEASAVQQGRVSASGPDTGADLPSWADRKSGRVNFIHHLLAAQTHVNPMQNLSTADGRIIEPEDAHFLWGEDELGVPDLPGRAGPAEEQQPESSSGDGKHQHRWEIRPGVSSCSLVAAADIQQVYVV